jgi:hypothetical protein
MDNTLKEDKRIWEMCQEYFGVYGEYAYLGEFSPKTKKNLIQNNLTEHDHMI